MELQVARIKEMYRSSRRYWTRLRNGGKDMVYNSKHPNTYWFTSLATIGFQQKHPSLSEQQRSSHRWKQDIWASSLTSSSISRATYSKSSRKEQVQRLRYPVSL